MSRPADIGDHRDAAIRDAIRRFQHEQGLDETGELDAETIQRLRREDTQRCELGDFPIPDPTERPA